MKLGEFASLLRSTDIASLVVQLVVQVGHDGKFYS
jgi:hypothetical protein